MATSLDAYHAWMKRGKWFLENERYDEAIQSFDKALEIIPTASDALREKGTALRLQGKYKEAIQCFDLALEGRRSLLRGRSLPFGEHILVLSEKGKAFLSQNLYNEALQCFDQALGISSSTTFAWEAWAGKGEALHSLAKYKEALPCFDNALEFDPRSSTFWRQKGSTLNMLERYEEAVVCFDKALKLDTESLLAWNGKGYALAMLDRYLDAFECYDKALGLSHGSDLAALSLCGKGVVFSRQGKYKEAIECFDKALGIQSEYPAAWSGKGEALVKQGYYDEAIECLKTAFQFFTKFKNISGAEKIRSRIDTLEKQKRLKAYELSLEQYKELIKALKPVTRSISFNKIKIKELNDIVKEDLKKKFYIVHEVSETNEYGFACSAKIGDKWCILSIDIIRDKEVATLVHIVITIYFENIKEIEEFLEDLAITLSDHIENETGREEIMSSPAMQRSIFITIKDSVLYKTTIGTEKDVERQIVDSIVSRSNV